MACKLDPYLVFTELVPGIPNKENVVFYFYFWVGVKVSAESQLWWTFITILI